MRSVPASLADPRPAFEPHRPVGFPPSRRTKDYYIYAPTVTPSVRRPPHHLCSILIYCPRVTRAASNSASYDKEAVDPSLASGNGVYLVRGALRRSRAGVLLGWSAQLSRCRDGRRSAAILLQCDACSRCHDDNTHRVGGREERTHMQQDKDSILYWRPKRSASERADSNIYITTPRIFCATKVTLTRH